MTISRRPNKRASNENAPGPSSASAIQMIAAVELARVGAWLDGNRVKLMITFPTAASPQQIGVRNPIRIEPPITNARPARHQQRAVSVPGEVKMIMPSAVTFRATTSLRRSRPPPGNPFGNAENSLCSGHLLFRRGRSNSNVLEEGKYVMPRKRHFRVTK
jgi:hypothetical protein